MDPEDGAVGMTWSLEGDDGDLFEITRGDAEDNFATATLSFNPPSSDPNFPDFENPMDKNGDNVYEVTIVITDSTFVNRDELDVTVKVINSTEDNRPGEVFLSNRQPEGASALTATLEDKDEPIRNLGWQWYRSVEGSVGTPEDCGAVSAPDAASPNTFTPDISLIDADGVPVTAAWAIIHGATSATYTPQWDEDADTAADPIDPQAADAGKCLMATATYTDWDAADPTMEDDPLTPTVDESQEHEKAHGVSYEPVVIEDRDNQKPEFREDPDLPNSALAVRYTISVPENSGAINIGILRDNLDAEGDSGTDGVLDEVVAAIDDETTADTDPADGVPDRTAVRNTDDIDDTLTYELSGPDAGSFKITGSIDMPVTDEDNAGQLMTTGGLNFEKKKEYRLTLKAIDPSGDSDSINIIINVEDVNDPLRLAGPEAEDHEENDTGAIATYKATDEDINGITYSLVPGLGDVAVFTISSLDGTLTFKPRPDGKARPNYEQPEDVAITDTGFTSVAVDNLYIVAVRARVAGTDDPATEATTFDGVEALNMDDMIHGIVRVRVLNMNEPPVFAMDMDAREIKENPDDLLQDPRLNRGAGGDPALASLDIGIPVIAIDDDNEVDVNGNFRNAAEPAIDAGEINEGHMVDGLTYKLSGDGAGTKFDIVKATGQILTIDKLDYEAKNSYVVTVTATDTTRPMGLSDSTQITINLTDVDEVPVGGLLTLIGDASHYHAEDNPDTTLGTYSVSGTTAVVTWTVEGADFSHFMLEGPDTSRSRMLKFKESPNFEMPRGQATSDTNTNTYMVTVKASAGDEVKMVEVTVMVTNEEEPGTVELSSMGGKVGTPLTAELSDDDIVVGAIDWQWSRVNPSTGGSPPITGARSSSYTPVMADVGNNLKVTASYTDGEGSGKSASASTTTPVADVNAAPEFAAAAATREVAENMESGTPVGSPVTAIDPNGDDITYGLAGVDAASFTVADGGQLETSASASLNYEAKSVYAVTITATDPEGLSGSIAVMVNLTDVDEPGMANLSTAQPTIGVPMMASVSDPDGTPTGKTYQWSYSDSMSGTFIPYAAEDRPSITPAEADFGRYLRITIDYSDKFGAKTVNATTASVNRNRAPEFASGTATREVAENTVSGTNIGAPVAATDADGDTLTYSLEGTDAASFSINSGTGQLMTRAALDYETKMSYTVMVTAMDPAGASASTTVTIMVTDVDEAVITPDPNAALIAMYDAVANGGNGNGMIEKDEVIAAINDYLFGTGDGTLAPSKAEVIRLINLYLFG